MEFLTANVWIIWAVVIVLFLIVEAVTVGLTSIWFAVGALAALVASLFNAAVWLQIVCFLAVSIIALFATKPLARKFNASHQPTNADMTNGMEGVVTERIDNLAGTGAVTLGGKVWTARSSDEDVAFEPGEKIISQRIEGVKLIVSAAIPAAEKQEEKV